MRSDLAKRVLPWLLALLLSTAAWGQQPTVNAGAMIKYTGPSTPAEDMRQTREYLSTLEASIAGNFAKSSGVEYIDRSNLLALFLEHRLGALDDFNPSSGALRGLLGKLDYLIIVEGSAPNTARVRIIDVETGAVKGAYVCQSKSGISRLLSSSSETPECVTSLVGQTLVLAKGRMGLKKDRLQRAADEKREAEKKAADEKREAEKRAAEQERKQAEEQRRQERELAAQQAEANRRQAEEERARQQAEAAAAAVKPRYEDVTARVSAEEAFWRGLDGQLRSAGHSLRPEIRTLLTSVRTKTQRCSDLLSNLRAAETNTCLDEVNTQLDKLEQYK